MTWSALVTAQPAPRLVAAAAKPGQTWKLFPTRTLADLPAAVTGQLDAPTTAFGGQAGRKVKATGFFYATNLAGRWWLVDPEGGLFLNKGVASVSTLSAPGAEAAFTAKFGNFSNWAGQTTAELRELGFNGAGAWSDNKNLENSPDPLNYTCVWNFMASYGRKRGGTFSQPGHTGYPNDCIFVFDPKFETFCDEHARPLAATKDDPHLLGHFSDNELPFKRGLLADYLRLPKEDYGYQAAMAWWQARHGANAGVKHISSQDDRDFLKFVVARYFRIVSAAIKKYDPNHLFLGSRFHGEALALAEVFQAAGPFVDVVSVNYYHAWTPDARRSDFGKARPASPF